HPPHLLSFPTRRSSDLREKILPIYYGFDSTLFPFREPKRWDGLRAPVIVMHGSLDHHHLREIALTAFERIQGEIPNVIFRFVGQDRKSTRLNSSHGSIS